MSNIRGFGIPKWMFISLLHNEPAFRYGYHAYTQGWAFDDSVRSTCYERGRLFGAWCKGKQITTNFVENWNAALKEIQAAVDERAII